MSSDDFGPLFREFPDLTKGLSPEEVEALKLRFAEAAERMKAWPVGGAELVGMSSTDFMVVIGRILARLDEIIEKDGGAA